MLQQPGLFDAPPAPARLLAAPCPPPAQEPDQRPLATFVLEGPSGPLYRGRGRLVDRRALERDRLAPPEQQLGVELRAVVWDDEPVEGAIGTIDAPWEDDQAWVFPYEIQEVVEASAPPTVDESQG